MRRFLPGVSLLVLASIVCAQPTGEVESIGFENHCRPDCWTPMVVRITPQTSKTDFHQIHVKLQDLDRDLPIFSRTISLTGASEGQLRQQKFRMYFIPPPTDGGILDAADPGALQDLQDRIKVSLHSAGGKWICDLPITSSVKVIDPRPGAFSDRRGTRFILAVSDGRSRPVYHDHATTALLGVMEDVAFVNVQPRDLPENVLGYDAIDGIVWMDADPAQLKAGGEEKFRALESYIRRGGRLVVCQPMEWQKMLALEDLLPVVLQGVEEKDDLMPLRAMARAAQSVTAFDQPQADRGDPWDSIKPPYRFARALPKPNAIVDEWITWKTSKDRSPYIARMPVGLGSVTWVAQDLGDGALAGKTKTGWVYVWEHVFDWKNEPLPVNSRTPDEVKRPYDPGFPMDFGKSLLTGMDLQSKSAWLITLAVVFFIGYWLLAGPGLFAYLAGRKKTELSWFLFGASAVAATALTVLIVKLVLRGPPELRHFSVVRVALHEPAVVISRMGLYIPRDGPQQIELKDAIPGAVTAISALPMHPFYVQKAPEITGPEYAVPIIDATSEAPAGVTVPYRSTLKKFQATWVGQIDATVQGSPGLVGSGWIEGTLTNNTGQMLRNVYVAFKYPGKGALAGDWILYLPSWEPGVSLDLAREFNRLEDGSGILPPGFRDDRNPRVNRKCRGKLALDWHDHWVRPLKAGALSDTLDDSGDPVRKSLPMLSLFERLKPSKADAANPQRVELLRRGARWLDLSHTLAAGALIVLAEADGPLPFPLEVEGDRVTGQGTIFYQFVLPLDHSKLPAQEAADTVQ